MSDIDYFTGICGADIRFGMPVQVGVHGMLIEALHTDPKVTMIGLATRNLTRGESVKIGKSDPRVTFDIVTSGKATLGGYRG